jgi:RNA polymerase sigma factor (sigma-70 family)
MLYDHYNTSVYRFVYYRVGSVALAEDLTSETFFRALRSMKPFKWQGKDFGAWLMTIARNLTADHYKAVRTRTGVRHRGHGRARLRHRRPRRTPFSPPSPTRRCSKPSESSRRSSRSA